MSESSEIKSVVRLEARNLPIESVTVFSDRAEVKRSFEVKLSEGLNDVYVENVSSSIDKESIRVDGVGAAIIHDVQYKDEFCAQEELDSDAIRALVNKQKELEESKGSVDDLISVYKKQLESINKLVDNVTLCNDKHPSLSFNDDTESTLEVFYNFHAKKVVDLKAKHRSECRKRDGIENELAVILRKIADLRVGGQHKRSICITLSATEDTTAKVELTYQVFNALWTPSYDIRVNTSQSATKLKVVYFGTVRQNTGEDWIDAQLILSTAHPRSGGSLPTVGTVHAQFPPQKPPCTPPPHNYSLFGAAQSQAFQVMRSAKASTFGAALPPEEFQVPMENITTESTAHVLSTTFSVPVRKTIPSDQTDHKVTVVNLDFKPILHLDTVPSKNTNVFLIATMVNTSPYPLLAGQASVYVDNSFSSNFPMKAVASGEKFDCSLGADQTVKIQYKPVHKYQQQLGMINKSSSTMYEQKIVVRNTKKEKIVLTLIEPVPKSTDEKIKIKLIAPELKAAVPSNEPTTNGLRAPEPGSRLSSGNALIWTVPVNAAEEEELLIKYSVECPQSETVSFVEKF